MRFSLVLAALLCFSTWMSMVHAIHGPLSSCCMQWSNTRVPVERIMDYTIQSEGVCPITAIIFQTKFGKRLCSDPNNKWAKKAILKVDVEKALLENRQNEDGSTSNITPTVSTTSKNAPQKKGRNGSRRQRKKSRRGRKGQRKRV
ncbi:eotaxin-like [Siniperca chuatsi]|uniref:eotaxin-like n=1 Tax=Siniperca chuatsi TaxID=119488 RepID=UPI001CE04739|nr:eotaxin-like [Siniperca chuatsi]